MFDVYYNFMTNRLNYKSMECYISRIFVLDYEDKMTLVN